MASFFDTVESRSFYNIVVNCLYTSNNSCLYLWQAMRDAPYVSLEKI